MLHQRRAGDRRDRPALLVARELPDGQTRFQDIAAGTGGPRDVLTARLGKLELTGMIERRRYGEHPPRDEYLLTEAGHGLQPVLLALKEWGDRHCNPGPSRSCSSTPTVPIPPPDRLRGLPGTSPRR